MKFEEALALKTQTDLSDLQYHMLRNSALSHNLKIYQILINLESYPEDVRFPEMIEKCLLQSMRNHTVTKIINILDLSES